MSHQEVTGQCLCGAVRFAITPPTKWCAHCHCSMCRRAHGAAFVTFCGVPAGQFRLTQGADALVRYRSSEAATRSFCGRCGSTLLFEGERWPGEVHVVRANIDGEIDRAPQAHAYFDRHVDWVELADHLPRLGGPNGNEPLG
ncbi:MAG: GFA family protein [Polyangiaceae bacterium]|nr:GFA family protein [Polyangiaceae bacterium]